MPTLSSTITSTLTVFVTLTASSYGLPGGVAEGLRGLSECSQDIVFPLLANSVCNAGDYDCICSEFDKSGAKDAVKSACNSDESDKWASWASSACISASSYSATATSSESSTPSATSVVSTTKYENGTSTAVYSSKTESIPEVTTAPPAPAPPAPAPPAPAPPAPAPPAPAPPAPAPPAPAPPAPAPPAPAPPAPAPPAPAPEVPAPETPSNGTKPVTPAQPETPVYSGAAVAGMELGNGQVAMLAGVLGMMGFAFAEL